ncbi:hypothetical protein NP493_1621g00016 [Ridgeia piscesae]|uniref:Fibrinogen C-terminal domain-containing protein n=1 Tax=Ridgeia piscesae TaxID=27915 RepID=A0AAD9JZ46_RIDPI|nr:hypothetical protein NP493_1621g00016 [Ridgeia piscesae]
MQQQRTQFEDLQKQFNISMQQQRTQLQELRQLLSALDCYDLKMKGVTTSGVYNIFLKRSNKYIKVFCEMTRNGGGWTVFQRRQDGSVDFWRDWATYKKGFGNLEDEFWLGNDYIHEITTQKNYTIRIDLEDFDGAARYAEYSSFNVAPESEYYKLSLGSYNGTAGDSFGYHSGKMFSTKDPNHDHDTYPGMHCAQAVRGGWWYGRCFQVSLNGQYLHGSYSSFYNGIAWVTFRGDSYSLKKTDMKLRPLLN